jgi:hypothetical protein
MKTLVVTPCGENIRSRTVGCLMSLALYVGKPGMSFAESEGAVAATQNAAVNTILANRQFTHLMLIDSDMVFPPTALHALMRRNVDIVGASYRARHDAHPRFYFPLGVFVPGTNLPAAQDPGDLKGNQTVAALPSGMMLIKRKVLEALDYPFFFMTYGSVPGEDMSNDINFCLKARKKGFQVHCDLDLSAQIEHLAVTGLPWK